jgi:RNA polymerase sigma-70 factor (ECF subfamily)
VDQTGLVERAAAGDREAFADLIRVRGAKLDGAARLITRDPELARDVVQETLIRAWRDLPRLRDRDRFDAWIKRLLVNAAMDELRRRRRRVVEVELTAGVRSIADDPTGRLADRDTLDRLLAGLPPEHRALIVQHYYLGVPLPEAAASLGISIGAAKARVHRSMASLRRALASDEALVAVKESNA